MFLAWREVDLGCGPISTSLTQGEADMLERLATESRVLEVGSAYGYSTIVMARVAREVVAVDPHEALASYGIFRANLAAYGVVGKVFVERCPFEGLQIAASYGLFDLVFIDGDHMADGVAHDIHHALQLIPSGGVIACHDYGEEQCSDVKPVIDELLPSGYLAADKLWVWQKP